MLGKSLLRKEGLRKLTGKAKYIDDVDFQNILYGTTVRSSCPRGKIKNIKFKEGIPWCEFTIVTAKDIPAKNSVALITYDQPFLAEKHIAHMHEPIVLLAHPDKYLVEEAKSYVEIEVEEQTPLFDIDEALQKKHVIWGEDNIFKKLTIEKDVDESIWKKADFCIEEEYETGAQEQLYIETNGIVADFNADQNHLTIYGSMQCPFYIQKALKALFDLPGEKIRIIQSETGGGFGGKEEYPSILSGHAALLSFKSKKPVKMIYDREEDMVATTKRHPSRTRHRTAVSKDGKLLAMDIDFVVDGGAYLTLSPVVLSRGAIHAGGSYDCPHVNISAKAVATNTPPHGAFRGFGAPQSIFALERQMDKIARTLKMCPVELRKKNFLSKNKLTATSQRIRDEIRLEKILDKALKESNYWTWQKKFAKENTKNNVIKRGIGFASFHHGSGFTGAGEKFLNSMAGVEVTREGKVRVLAASTEIGQGTNTLFTQIVSHTLNIGADCIEVATPDTHNVPDSGPTVASRTCMVVGKLIENSALKLKRTLEESGFLPAKKVTEDVFVSACKKYIKKNGELKVFDQYRQAEHIEWDDEKYKGDAYAAFAWATYVARVAVNMQTFEVQVEDFVAVQEIGKIVNPILAEGQIEGGVAQGIGYALYENVVWKNGGMANGQMTNYIMPTSMDLPTIRVFFEEKGGEFGPKGAKGIGELPMDGPAPAILNAVENATGISVNAIPLTPERLFAAWEKQRRAK